MKKPVDGAGSRERSLMRQRDFEREFEERLVENKRLVQGGLPEGWSVLAWWVGTRTVWVLLGVTLVIVGAWYGLAPVSAREFVKVALLIGGDG